MKWYQLSEPTVVKTVVVEVEKSPSPPETPESISAVESLRSHSGFQYLLKKLRYQRARLHAELDQNRHPDLRAVEFIQSGIHWCNWLQSQLNFAHERYLSMRESTATESLFFDQLRSQLDLVGQATSQSE